MSMDQICGKKDKRLLVLLAFGAVVIFSDMNIFAAKTSGPLSHTWIEFKGQDPKNRLFRSSSAFDLTYQAMLKELFAEKEFHRPKKISKDQSFIANVNSPISFRKKEGGQIEVSSVSPRLAFFLGLPFSINNATAEDLVLIPGIGPSMASRIIRYRSNSGPVASAYQMEEIPGIGSITRKKLQNYFTYNIAIEKEHTNNN